MEGGTTSLVAMNIVSGEILLERKDILVNVRTLIAEHRVWRLLEVSSEGDLVRHRAGREKEGGLFASELGHMGLEGEHARLMVDVVADGGENSILVHVLCRD